MDWRIKALKGKWSEEKNKKAVKIVSDLIERYAPNVLAIKKLHPSRRTENLLRITNTIKSFTRRRDLKIYQYYIKEIEKSLIEGQKLNKQNLYELMARLYPALHHDLKKEQSHKNPYYFRVFEAVALGVACFHSVFEVRIDKQEKRQLKYLD
jgi:Holliday junction resolvasome RuvABC endonuclease subunit